MNINRNFYTTVAEVTSLSNLFDIIKNNDTAFIEKIIAQLKVKRATAIGKEYSKYTYAIKVMKNILKEISIKKSIIFLKRANGIYRGYSFDEDYIVNESF